MVVAKDRTQELHKIYLGLKARQISERGAVAAAGGGGAGSSGLVPLATTSSSAQTMTPPNVALFYEAAQQYSQEMASVSQSIANLAKLIQAQTVFDDSAVEISTLTVIIKEKLAKLQDKMLELQQLKEAASTSASRGLTATGGGTAQASKHGDTVISTLRSRLVNTSQSFKTVLQRRSKTMKDTCSRRNVFSSDRPTTFESALFQQDDAASSSDSAMLLGGAGAGPPQQALALQHHNVNHYRQRADAVLQVEAAVNEVSEMFQDFNRLVHEQGELVVRIDSDVDDALSNVNAGNSELLKYLQNLSSNRGLIIKVFVVLFLFLMFFGFVVVR